MHVQDEFIQFHWVVVALAVSSCHASDAGRVVENVFELV